MTILNALYIVNDIAACASAGTCDHLVYRNDKYTKHSSIREKKLIVLIRKIIKEQRKMNYVEFYRILSQNWEQINRNDCSLLGQ